MVEVLLNKVLYQIDEFGNILKRRGQGFVRTFPDRDGYLKVAIKRHKNGPTHNEAVHRVVYRAFHGEIPDGMTVDHIDEDKTNNHKDNLQLMLATDNAAKGNAKNWLIVSPDGVEIEVNNLRKFCREHRLHPSHIVTHNYKGWTAKCLQRLN